jgi:hypothetical protein
MPSTASFNYEIVDEKFRAGNGSSPSTVQQTLIVERKTGNVNLGKDPSLMLTENLIPELNEYYNVTSPGVRDWQQYARFKGWDGEYVGNGKVRLVLNYSTFYMPDPTIVSGQELALPATTDYQSMIRSIKLYRYGYVTDPPSTVSDTTTADIGGISVQGTRGALDVQVSQMRIRLRLMANADVQGISTAAVVVVQYVNKLSNASFLGFPAYSILCEGASLANVDHDFYEIVFDFLYDAFYHFDQVVSMDSDGRPTMNGTNYLRVDWKRLPRTKIDMNNIFSTATRQKARAEKGFF